MNSTAKARFVCIHGHFYQPPRENPWIEEIERQESAAPYHDWNERIAAECYEPNANARILDDRERIRLIVNNYATISFDFGPTLLSWMERHDPETYRAVLEADRLSRDRFSGCGSAMALAYNHAILPLCNRRDLETQVVWGLRDFEVRFGRAARGMWLPETAVDLDSLDALARHGVEYTVLAPGQAEAWRPLGDERWRPVEAHDIDPRRPYRVALPSGRHITVFLYDGPISRAVAFERLLTSGDRFARRLVASFTPGADSPQLVHVATDGETYGHHHRFGDMALAYALRRIEGEGLARVTNYPEFLELYPPRHEARVREHTAWSCTHGLGRWSEDCGCSIGAQVGWNQSWRRPLRDALDWLRDALAERYDALGGRLLRDPWTARDAYVELVLDRSAGARRAFLARHGRPGLSQDQQRTVLELLEMQRHALLMYTSCGWFFDEVSGIETVQVLQYAARAAELADAIFDDGLGAGFRARLGRVRSNRSEYGNAERVFASKVEPARVDLVRFAANHVAGTLFGDDGSDRAALAAFEVEDRDRRVRENGRRRLVLGRVGVASRRTGQRADLIYGFLDLGDHNFNGGVREWPGETRYAELLEQTSRAFESSDLPEVLRRLEQHLGALPHSMRTLFRDQRHRIVRRLLDRNVADVESVLERLYADQAPLLRFLAEVDTSAPRALRETAGLVLSTRLRRELEAPRPDPEVLRRALEEARRTGVELDATSLAFATTVALERLLRRVAEAPSRDLLDRLAAVARLVGEMPFEMNLARPQNLFYRLVRAAPAIRGADEADRESMRKIGACLGVVVDPVE